MKRLNMLFVVACCAAACGAFASTATGTTITAPTNTLYTGYFHMTSEGHIIIHNPIAKIECHSTIDGDFESHGPGQTVKGKFTSINNSPCTNSWHVTTVTPGSFEIHWVNTHTGTLTSSGMTIEATRFGITCRYSTANTDFGTITDSHTSGDPLAQTTKETTATLHLNGTTPFHSGSGLCGSAATKWTGSYKFYTPDTLYIDKD